NKKHIIKTLTKIKPDVSRVLQIPESLFFEYFVLYDLYSWQDAITHQVAKTSGTNLTLGTGTPSPASLRSAEAQIRSSSPLPLLGALWQCLQQRPQMPRIAAPAPDRAPVERLTHLPGAGGQDRPF